MRFFLFLFAASLAAQTARFDVEALDPKADPCVDFAQYACGGWHAKNPIPSDRSNWGKMYQLRETTQEVLKSILEHGKGKAGDHYAACMDEKTIEARGAKPLQPVLDRIAAISSRPRILEEIVQLHRIGVNAVFRMSPSQDLRDATQVIADFDQGGLTMPDRDYYLRDDARSTALRDKYKAHVARMFQLLGDSAEVASAKAATVLRFETPLAKASLDRVARRNPENLYHRMTLKEAAAIMPSLPLESYLSGVGAPAVESINIAVPDFFKQVDSLFSTAPIEEWKTYLSWRYISSSTGMLPAAFVNEAFAWSRELTGVKELPARWKRCVAAVDSDLGEEVGKLYVAQRFTPATKAKTLELVNAVARAFEKNVNELTWMTPETKKKALAKLRLVSNKIGYPDQWRDYSALQIRRDDAFGNNERSNRFERARRMKKIGKPVDKKEWFMTPATVNAYYDPQVNSINFPAARLQPPFYNPSLDDAVNYGGIAGVIGHELTHGFDDQGGRFDGDGNLRNWWSAEDLKAFEHLVQCVEKQYSQYPVVGDLNINGKFTLGEDVADNGGVRIAFMALMEQLAGKPREKIDGFTPEQRFFLSYAHTRCEQMTDKVARLRQRVDPHSPGRWRINGVVSNMPEFRQAFGCKVGQPMARENSCRVW